MNRHFTLLMLFVSHSGEGKWNEQLFEKPIISLSSKESKDASFSYFEVEQQ